MTQAAIGKKLRKKTLADVATIVKPETILAWHRKLIAQKVDGSGQRMFPRPTTDRPGGGGLGRAPSPGESPLGV